MTLAFTPQKPDQKTSKQILDVLPQAKSVALEIAGQRYTLPSGLRAQLEELLRLSANGKPSTITAYKDELSSQEAADFLRVSRQFLVNEADAGRIACRKIGKHRRFLFTAVLAYQALTEQESLEARQALADQAQALGWDD